MIDSQPFGKPCCPNKRSVQFIALTHNLHHEASYLTYDAFDIGDGSGRVCKPAATPYFQLLFSMDWT